MVSITPDASSAATGYRASASAQNTTSRSKPLRSRPPSNVNPIPASPESAAIARTCRSSSARTSLPTPRCRTRTVPYLAELSRSRYSSGCGIPVRDTDSSSSRSSASVRPSASARVRDADVTRYTDAPSRSASSRSRESKSGRSAPVETIERSCCRKTVSTVGGNPDAMIGPARSGPSISNALPAALGTLSAVIPSSPASRVYTATRSRIQSPPSGYSHSTVSISRSPHSAPARSASRTRMSSGNRSSHAAASMAQRSPHEVDGQPAAAGLGSQRPSSTTTSSARSAMPTIAPTSSRSTAIASASRFVSGSEMPPRASDRAGSRSRAASSSTTAVVDR